MPRIGIHASHEQIVPSRHLAAVRLERVLAAFREGGGEGKPVFPQVHLSWAPDEQQALDIAYDQWRTNLFSPRLPWDPQTVEQFEEAARFVRPEDVGEELEPFVDAFGERVLPALG